MERLVLSENPDLEYFKELFYDLALSSDINTARKEIKEHLRFYGYEIIDKVHVQFTDRYIDLIAVIPQQKKTQFALVIGNKRIRKDIADDLKCFDEMPGVYILRDSEYANQEHDGLNIISVDIADKLDDLDIMKSFEEEQKKKNIGNFWGS